METCNICSEQKKIYAKRLCGRCYQNDWRKNKRKFPIAKCICGNEFEKKYKKHQYCSRKCRPRERQKEGICLKCNNFRLLRINGWCLSCDTIRRKILRPIIICKSCNKEKPHFSRGLCENCYCSLWQRKKYNESEEVRKKKSDYQKLNRNQKNNTMRKYFSKNKEKGIIRGEDRVLYKNKKEKCLKCSSRELLEIHHEDYRKRKISILCKKCHGKKHRKHKKNLDDFK